MDKTDLKAMYLRDMKRAPRVLTAIRRASRRPDRTLVLSFRPFDDDPFLLYSTWGIARDEGVTLVLPPS
jgi:hypothetical protein